MQEVATFLQQHPPFQHLRSEQIAQIAAQVQIAFVAAGSVILHQDGQPATCLYLIRRGQVDMLHASTQGERVVEQLDEGDLFGFVSLIRKRPPLAHVRARSDSLLYLIPTELFEQLRRDEPLFAQFFAKSLGERLDHALNLRHATAAPELFQTRLRDLLQRPVVAVAPDATVRAAARLMSEQRVSSLLVDLPPYSVYNRQSGILTDRDLRVRVLAAGLSDQTPVREVMSTPVVTLSSDSLVFEAMLLMLERGVRHLPVTEQQQIVGMVSYTDLLRRQSNNPLLLPRWLERAQGAKELRAYADQVGAVVVALLDTGARVADIGRMVAVAHDALQQRLLTDLEAELGPPPVPYAWLVLGSEGRFEQTLRTDQDNALIYADHAPPEAADYFARLAEHAIAQLEQCGFPRCPGEIMATNPRWCQPLATWQSYFQHWIEQPDENALLQSAIFFDYRQIHGTLMVEPLLRPVVLAARQHPVFLARLARAALRNPATLSFWQQLGLDRKKAGAERFDLKLRGTAPIVDLARLFGLAVGSSETNTQARLQAAAGSLLGQATAVEVSAAFDLLSLIRLRHQVTALHQGIPASNQIVLTDLEALERRELKEALRAVHRLQQEVELLYQTGRLA
jgi:CBS domain-containing protein